MAISTLGVSRNFKVAWRPAAFLYFPANTSQSARVWENLLHELSNCNGPRKVQSSMQSMRSQPAVEPDFVGAARFQLRQNADGKDFGEHGPTQNMQIPISTSMFERRASRWESCVQWVVP